MPTPKGIKLINFWWSHIVQMTSSWMRDTSNTNSVASQNSWFLTDVRLVWRTLMAQGGASPVMMGITCMIWRSASATVGVSPTTPTTKMQQRRSAFLVTEIAQTVPLVWTQKSASLVKILPLSFCTKMENAALDAISQMAILEGQLMVSINASFVGTKASVFNAIIQVVMGAQSVERAFWIRKLDNAIPNAILTKKIISANHVIIGVMAVTAPVPQVVLIVLLDFSWWAESVLISVQKVLF